MQQVLDCFKQTVCDFFRIDMELAIGDGEFDSFHLF